MPGEDGAFDAGGVFVDAGEGFEVAEGVVVGFGLGVGDHLVEGVEDLVGFGEGFAFDALGHHGGGGAGYGAAHSLEGDVVDGTGGYFEVDGYLVAAEGVEAFGGVAGVGYGAEVAGFVVVF